MAKSNADRSEDRRANIIFRTSVARREELRAIAASHGVSVQIYLEAVAFGQPLASKRSSGPRPQQELPLTG
ncbi:hypothetical protein V3G39_00025 (plasmid) [Dermatophilaceae bacterium Sec6.4]